MSHAVQWIDAYPDAKSYVCPGGKKKYPDINYTQVSPGLGRMHILVALKRIVKIYYRLSTCATDCDSCCLPLSAWYPMSCM